MATNNTIRFLLNDEQQELADLKADETLLDFLRLKRTLRGTKEGCAEGDCGACTVLVGRIKHGELVYETVNACIRFVGSLNACHVVTVENLSDAKGGLHAVQKAMVEHHGSQCGFCTPGIVMSLYGLFLKNASPTEREIEIALQGNLCRCTGYEPIVQAALSIANSNEALEQKLKTEADAIRRKLDGIVSAGSVEVSDEFFVPANTEEFATFYANNPNARIIAGATDVGLWVTKHFANVTPAIFISHLDELALIEEDERSIRLGATTSYTDTHEVLGRNFSTLRPYWNRIGGEQVRNMGTIGGNLANGSPIGDTPPPLIALGAVLHLHQRGKSRSLPLEDFFIEYGKQDRKPGEFVEAVEIPKLKGKERFSVYKISKRLEEDISAVTAAFKLDLANDGTVRELRICMGGMAGTPQRASKTEQALIGRSWCEAEVRKAAEFLGADYQPLSDWRASANYRSLTAASLLMRFYLETTSSDTIISLDQIEEIA